MYNKPIQQFTLHLDMLLKSHFNQESARINYPKSCKKILVESAGQQMMVITTVNQNDEPNTHILVRE